jgi:hypothetical protein
MTVQTIPLMTVQTILAMTVQTIPLMTVQTIPPMTVQTIPPMTVQTIPPMTIQTILVPLTQRHVEIGGLHSPMHQDRARVSWLHYGGYGLSPRYTCGMTLWAPVGSSAK